MSTESGSGQQTDRAAVAFHPPLLLLLLIVGGVIGSWIWPASFLPDSLALGVGLPIVVIALAVFAWAVTTMTRGGASVPTHTPTDAIVGHGPFRFSRNPIYLSMTLLLIGIGVTGVLMRYVVRVDVINIKVLTHGLVTGKPFIAESINSLFFVHLFLITVLISYFPFSKLMHMGGVFLSPTRNMTGNTRAVRHVNPWNYPVKVHTYQEYEDEFREHMIEAGLPVDKGAETAAETEK